MGTSFRDPPTGAFSLDPTGNFTTNLLSKSWIREWWDILLSLYYKFTTKSVGERILKIRQYLAKLGGII